MVSNHCSTSRGFQIRVSPLGKGHTYSASSSACPRYQPFEYTHLTLLKPIGGCVSPISYMQLPFAAIQTMACHLTVPAYTVHEPDERDDLSANTGIKLGKSASSAKDSSQLVDIDNSSSELRLDYLGLKARQQKHRSGGSLPSSLSNEDGQS